MLSLVFTNGKLNRKMTLWVGMKVGIKEQDTGDSNIDGRLEDHLRLQTPVGRDEGKSSTGDEASQEGADENQFETKLIEEY